MVRRVFVLVALVSLSSLPVLAQGQGPGTQGGTWRFAVSGDSRNCGDVVMPAIAAGALANQVAFYWHLGDLRKMYDFDEDMQHETEYRARAMSIFEYHAGAWDDFIANQIAPFGSTPFVVSIGNHELIPPKTRDEFIAQFGDWLGSPTLKAQRLADNPQDHRLKTYFHWLERGVDFISLDNASGDQFDTPQLKWFKGVLERDLENPAVRTLVDGMHRALPESISFGHGMNESAQGTESGRSVYGALLRARSDGHKNVYVLASHSHTYIDGIFNTEYWRSHGGVLPGWIVGTAGAVRYPLPSDTKDARAAETNVYGYMLGTVANDGTVSFEFRRVAETDVPGYVLERFTPEFVHWCFEKNTGAPATQAMGTSTAAP